MRAGRPPRGPQLPPPSPTLLGAEEKPHDLNKVFKVAFLLPLCSSGGRRASSSYLSGGLERCKACYNDLRVLTRQETICSSSLAPSISSKLLVYPPTKADQLTAPSATIAKRANPSFAPSPIDRIACAQNFQCRKDADGEKRSQIRVGRIDDVPWEGREGKAKAKLAENRFGGGGVGGEGPKGRTCGRN